MENSSRKHCLSVCAQFRGFKYLGDTCGSEPVEYTYTYTTIKDYYDSRVLFNHWYNRATGCRIVCQENGELR